MAPLMMASEKWGRIILAVGAGIMLLFAVIAVMAKPERPAADTATESAPNRTASTTLPGSPIPPSPGEAYKIGGFGSPWLEGVYQAPGGARCRWTVQRDLAGNPSSIVDSGRGGAPARVALRDGQYFTSEGCGTWQRVGRI